MAVTTAQNNQTQSDLKPKKMSSTSCAPRDLEKLKTLLTQLSTSSDRDAVAQSLASAVRSCGVLSLVNGAVLPSLTKTLTSKKSTASARVGAISAIDALPTNNLAHQVEPFIIPFLSTLLELQAHKDTGLKKLSGDVAHHMVSKINPHACSLLVPQILDALGNSCKWQTKMLALELLIQLTEHHTSEFFVAVPDVIPAVSDCMWDTKSDVQKRATETMTTLCKLISNKDIERFIPAVIRCINHPENVAETIHLLGATTFVQEVDSATLSIMVPLLA